MFFLEEDRIFTEIYDLLYWLGITGNYTGFFYCSYAVYLACQQPDRLLLVTKWLYPDVAKYYGTQWKNVEWNIRTITDEIWRTNRERLEELAGQPLSERPAPSRLISILTSHISSRWAA